MKSSIVIISRQEDSHLRFVMPHLHSPVTILNPLDITTKDELSYHISNQKGLTITYQSVELKPVHSVWLRKPTLLRHLDLPVAKQHVEYSRNALQSYGRLLYSLLQDAFWVSDYFAVQRADSKPYQLQMAHRLGLRIPETCFTNNAATANHFIATHDSVIVKPLATAFPKLSDGTHTIFYAQKIMKEARPDTSNLHLAPAIFQQMIDYDLDIRVTIIGSLLFAATIKVHNTGKNPRVRDWRSGHYDGKLEISPYTLPADIADRCHALVRNLGLPFGAIDLVLDLHGNYWFLENNPNGQWAFIEEATGQPIGQAVAQLLEKGAIN